VSQTGDHSIFACRGRITWYTQTHVRGSIISTVVHRAAGNKRLFRHLRHFYAAELLNFIARQDICAKCLKCLKTLYWLTAEQQRRNAFIVCPIYVHRLRPSSHPPYPSPHPPSPPPLRPSHPFIPTDHYCRYTVYVILPI